MKKIYVGLSLLVLLAANLGFAKPSAPPAVLRNGHIEAVFARQGNAWSLKQCRRPDGSDVLSMDSDEFEILLLDGSRFTVEDYKVAELEREHADGRQVVRFHYKPIASSGSAPAQVIVSYTLGTDPFIRKTVFLKMKEGDVVDRLQVLRFSSEQTASHGGEGQPVFLGNWFAAMDYPAFYSRHSDGFVNPEYSYTGHYTIDLEDGADERAPRDGLVTLFHFPGHAKQQADGSWGIASKPAVLGLSATPGENAELALLDYINLTRRPARSHLHHNNWYNREAKHLTVDGYVNDFARTLAENLARYGAHLDAMVPDDGWQQKKDYARIYEPGSHHEPLPEISGALESLGIGFGIWLALDGSHSSLESGIKLGYTPAVTLENYKPPRQLVGQKYFDILNPKYQTDLKESLRFLIEDANVSYFKHDFNHCYTTHYLHPRHAREACLDVTLGLIAYERSLNPNVYINYTNGSTFSPFWLQFMECIWMQAGDSPSNSDWPQLSLREGATSYRDNHFFKSFNNPSVCVRPVLPIANFMTHGILYTESKPFTDFKDTLLDWSNYVVMFLGRGTLLKELYTSNTLFDDAQWEVLGKACAWAQQNQDRMLNTVLIGGDCAKGQVYGYVSWVNNRAVLVVRNPDRAEQTLTVPFDDSVYFRGTKGKAYHARAIYPFVEQMPWTLTSGEAMSVTVPGDSVLIYELEPGSPLVKTALQPAPLPATDVTKSASKRTLKISVPDEDLPRYDLVIEAWGLADAVVAVDGNPVEPTRYSNGRPWTLASYDLRAYRGKSITATVSAEAFKGEVNPRLMHPVKPGDSTQMEVWLVADRQVDAPAAPADEVLPLTIGQNYRRQTQCLVPETPLQVK